MTSTTDITKFSTKALIGSIKENKKTIEDYLRGMESVVEELAKRLPSEETTN